MVNKFLIIFMAMGVFFVSCREEEKQALEQKKQEVEKILFLGADIYEAKRKLEAKGVKVGNIEDLTKTGDPLSMLVTLKEFDPNFLDTIGYASDPHVNLQPWKENQVNYLVVDADKRGKIVGIEAK